MPDLPKELGDDFLVGCRDHRFPAFVAGLQRLLEMRPSENLAGKVSEIISEMESDSSNRQPDARFYRVRRKLDRSAKLPRAIDCDRTAVLAIMAAHLIAFVEKDDEAGDAVYRMFRDSGIPLNVDTINKTQTGLTVRVSVFDDFLDVWIGLPS